MKKISTLFQIIAVLLLFGTFSCKKNLLNNIETPQPVANLMDSNAVSMSFASLAAVTVQTHPMISRINKTAINGMGILTTKAVLDSVAVPNNEHPSYFIFNYVGGGFVIISADKRVEPLLAFNDKGHFNADTTKIAPSVIQWLVVNDKNMQLVKKNPQLKASRYIQKLWMDLIGQKPSASGKQKLQNVPPPPPCEDSYTSYQVGPYLTTTWSQWAPFNGLTPWLSPSYYSGNTPTGCVATAMAQVMYYWHYPNTYSWSVMPLTDACCLANLPVAQLMLDAGTSVGMVYTDTYSKPGSSNFSVSSALKNYFSYSTANEKYYDYTSLDYTIATSNLDAGKPVIFSGDDSNTDAHEWVCDGYMLNTYHWCPTEQYPYESGSTFLLWHMNWGWGGESDGWYNDSTWYVFLGGSLHYYSNHRYMVYNIHP